MEINQGQYRMNKTFEQEARREATSIKEIFSKGSAVVEPREYAVTPQSKKTTGVVWLLNPYVNLPGETWRLGRSSLLAYELAKRGHRVVLWTGNISHRSKNKRSEDWHEQVVNDGFCIRLVPSVEYKKNIGLRRLFYEEKFARQAFQKGLFEEGSPSIIVAHDPPQICGHYGVKWAKKFNVPLITDTVDLWPEHWVLLFPKKARWVGRVIFWPFFAWRKRNWKHASGYTTLADKCLDLVHDTADPLRKKPSCVAYNGIDVQELRDLMEGTATVAFPEKKPGVFRAIFAGTLGPSYDLDPIIEAARIAKSKGLPIEFCVAGDGPKRFKIEAAAAENENLVDLGKLTPGDLAVFYKSCDVGLCAYSERSNVEMPDKFYDYTAAGLSVVNSLVGEVKDYIRDHEVGLQYTAGNGQEMFDQVYKLYSNPALQAKYKTNSYSVAFEFDNDVQITKYADLVEELI